MSLLWQILVVTALVVAAIAVAIAAFVPRRLGARTKASLDDVSDGFANGLRESDTRLEKVQNSLEEVVARLDKDMTGVRTDLGSAIGGVTTDLGKVEVRLEEAESRSERDLAGREERVSVRPSGVSRPIWTGSGRARRRLRPAWRRMWPG